MLDANIKLSELQKLVAQAPQQDASRMFRSIRQSMKAEGYTVSMQQIEQSARRVIGWEPSPADPIVDAAAELASVAHLIYCDVYDPDILPAHCLDNEEE
jgi:hypothetical protein